MMLSPEILRIILLLSLLATGYVLILEWNENSKTNQPSPERAITKPIENVQALDSELLGPISNQSTDVPDDSFLLVLKKF